MSLKLNFSESVVHWGQLGEAPVLWTAVLPVPLSLWSTIVFRSAGQSSFPYLILMWSDCINGRAHFTVYVYGFWNLMDALYFWHQSFHFLILMMNEQYIYVLEWVEGLWDNVKLFTLASHSFLLVLRVLHAAPQTPICWAKWCLGQWRWATKGLHWKSIRFG